MAATHILTTHVGSLPRSAAVTDLVFAQERGDAVDAATFGRVIGAAVDDYVAKQVAAGIASAGSMATARAPRPPISRPFPASSSARRRAAARRLIAGRAASARSRR